MNLHCCIKCYIVAKNTTIKENPNLNSFVISSLPDDKDSISHIEIGVFLFPVCVKQKFNSLLIAQEAMEACFRH